MAKLICAVAAIDAIESARFSVYWTHFDAILFFYYRVVQNALLPP